MRQSEAKLLRGLLPYLILKCGEVQSFHGYQLIMLLRKRFGVYFGPSTIYPLLKFLENEGFLISHWETPGAVERTRKVFTITDDGRAAVEALTSTMQAVSRFEGRIPQEPQKPERHNMITLEH